MRGMRPLVDAELATVAQSFRGLHRARNRCLFLWLYYLGWRISELLSLTWEDVLLPGGDPKTWVALQRRNRKGRREGITDQVTPAMRSVLSACRDAELAAGRLIVAPQRIWPISRQGAWKVLVSAYERGGVGRHGVGCHGIRKAHGLWVYRDALTRLRRGEGAIDPMRAAARSLHHTSVASTEHYLPVDDATVQAARESMPNLVDTLSEL
jgi:integrase